MKVCKSSITRLLQKNAIPMKTLWVNSGFYYQVWYAPDAKSITVRFAKDFVPTDERRRAQIRLRDHARSVLSQHYGVQDTRDKLGLIITAKKVSP